jgi:hypothetical protein
MLKADESPCLEVDFDECFFEPERSKGSKPGSDLLPGERLHCVTHGVAVTQHQPSYFQAVQRCRLVDVANPHLRARRATRTSTHLSADDVVKLYLGMLRANLQGMQLTYFATIAWSTLGLTDDAEIQAATQALFARLREWSVRCRSKGAGAPGPVPLAWVWCHERGKAVGLHTHILAHVPHRYTGRVGKVICRFLEAWTGQPLQNGETGQVTFLAKSPRLRRLKVAPYTFSLPRPRALAFQRNVMRYMLKGVDPDSRAPKAAGLHRGLYLDEALKLRRVEPQGVVLGKRCGYSVFNLGKTAFADFAARRNIPADEPETLLALHGFTFGNAAFVARDMQAFSSR